MKHYILFTLFIIPFNLSAQVLPTNYWAIKWVNSSILTPIWPHFRFGVEKRWGNHSVSGQAGYSIPRTYVIDNTIRGKTAGFAGRLEWRQYSVVKPEDQAFDMYLGAEVFYFTKHNNASGIYTPRDGARNIIGDDYKDEYVYTRTTWGAVSKFGLQYRTKSHLLIEFNVGLGPKVVNNIQRHRDNPSDFEEGYPDLTQPQTDYTFTKISLAVPFLASIGYWF